MEHRVLTKEWLVIHQEKYPELNLSAIQKLVSQMDQLLLEKPSVLVAIDGGSASGKTTLASLIKAIYNCNVFHMDSFFLRPHQRTEKRLDEIGGNVDYERFHTEVLEPLLKGKPFSYQPYNCRTQKLDGLIEVEVKPLNIIEGAYSMHPTLSDAYDLSVFLGIDTSVQAERILVRNGPEVQKRFIAEWIPMENRYFEKFQIANQCDLIL